MQNKMLILWLFSEVCVTTNQMDRSEDPPEQERLRLHIESTLSELRVLLEGLSNDELREVNKRINATKTHFAWYRSKVWPVR